MPGPVDRLCSGDPAFGETSSLLAVHRGEVVVERYGEGVDATTNLRSWSMAKSMLHAAVGMLVAEGALDPAAPAAVPAWQTPGDPRRAITLGQLLVMRSGLVWVEEPEPGQRSDAVEMVYGNGGRAVPDTAAWAADRGLEAEPGARFRYSSGTSNIVSGIAAGVVGAGSDYERWLRQRLFEPLGMSSARPRFDDAGTWIASSFCSCTARDFARFGALYLDGVGPSGERLLPESWVERAGIETGRDALGRVHSEHWWLLGGDPWGARFCSGFAGQYIVVVPALDLVVVRTGQTATEMRPNVAAELRALVATFEG